MRTEQEIRDKLERIRVMFDVHNRRNIKGEYELALEWVLGVEGEK